MNLPIGTIIAYFGDERTFDATGDFLICNGSPLKRKQYQQLYFHLSKIDPQLILDNDTFKLPDLRGEFLRGCDNNRNVDPRRTVGTFQEDSIKKQKIEFNIPKAKGPGSSRGLDGGSNLFVNGTEKVELTYGDGVETRPRNVAVNWIIKAK